MAASIIKFTTSSSLSELDDAIQSVISEGAESLLLLTCIDNGYNQQQIDVMLKACPVPICGGLFPKIILQEESYSKGAIVLGLMMTPKIINYSMLSSTNADLKTYIQQNSKDIECYQNFIVIADALCAVSENFTDEFYNYIGSDVTTIGGGAGSLNFSSQSIIYTNQGLISDAIQVIALPSSITNGIGHGWEILDGPYLVTASEGHYVHSLNYKPTFEVYRDVIQSKTNQILTQAVFFELAKSFPLGLITLEGELFVRDPIQTNGAYLECVGNVPVNSMVYLLKGDPEKMILATQQTAQAVAEQGQPETLLLFDCISRDLFMGDAITSELQAIQHSFPDTCLVGAMTLGEIANTSCGSIRLLNKSTVLGAF